MCLLLSYRARVDAAAVRDREARSVGETVQLARREEGGGGEEREGENTQRNMSGFNCASIPG